MPYINEIRRRFFRDHGYEPINAGDLNYGISKLVDCYLKAHGVRYETLNAVTGALESAKLEFYRRIVGPYEDQKRFENGDVYTVDMQQP